MFGQNLNAEFPAQVHLRIENKWLDDNANNDNAYIDCRDLDSTNAGRRMRPRGILIGINGATNTATTAQVRMVLWGENHAQADVYTLAVGINHPYCPKFIYASRTNGRDIKVLG